MRQLCSRGATTSTGQTSTAAWRKLCRKDWRQGPVSVEKQGNHKWLLQPQDGSERKTIFLTRLAMQILLFPVTKSSARMLLRQCLAACRLQGPHMLPCLHVHILDEVAKMTLRRTRQNKPTKTIVPSKFKENQLPPRLRRRQLPRYRLTSSRHCLKTGCPDSLFTWRRSSRWTMNLMSSPFM